MKLPRRSFAATFVLTACTAAAPLEPNPPQFTPTPVQKPAPPDAATVVLEDHEDHEDPDREEWRVLRFDKGCELAVVEHCPPTAHCNPPRPRPYTCPSDLPKGRRVLLTHEPGAKDCTLIYEADCGPEVGSCVPEEKRKIACPR